MADLPPDDAVPDPDVRALIEMIDAQTRRLQLVLGLAHLALADLDHAIVTRETLGGSAGSDMAERARGHLRTILRRGGPEDLPARPQGQRSDPVYERFAARAVAVLTAREAFWVASELGTDPARVGRLELELDLLSDELAAAILADPDLTPCEGDKRSQGLAVAGWFLFAERGEGGSPALQMVRVAGRD